MKLKTRLFMAFFIVILVPLLLSVLFVVGFLLFQADQFRVKYGIDILALPPAEKTIVANMVLSALVILFITAMVLSVWLDQGINIPITNLTRAAKNIRDEIPDVTKIIIAQRVASVMEADQIVVLDAGCVSAVGTHEELLQTSDIYREVYESQMKGGEDE